MIADGSRLFARPLPLACRRSRTRGSLSCSVTRRRGSTGALLAARAEAKAAGATMEYLSTDSLRRLLPACAFPPCACSAFAYYRLMYDREKGPPTPAEFKTYVVRFQCP